MSYDIPERWDTGPTERAIALIWKERERYESMRQKGEGVPWGRSTFLEVLLGDATNALIRLERRLEEEQHAS